MRSLRITLLLARFGQAGRGARSAYLLLTVAVAVTAWLVLSAMASPYIAVKRDVAADGIVVRNARGSSAVLPLRYAARLDALVGVQGVVYLDLQLLQCANGDTITVNAYGGSGVADALRSDEFPEHMVRRWQVDQAGLLVNTATAEACNWRPGQGITPPDVMGRPIPFNVTGVRATRQGEGMIAFAHYDYINHRHSLLGNEDRVIDFSVQAGDARQNESLVARIEAAFAHEDPPVLAYPDTARENARARFGNVQYMLTLVMGAVFVCCMLVLASVMAHAAQERRAHLGTLYALGFPRRLFAAGFVVEVFGIVAGGAVIGLVLGAALLQWLPGWLAESFGRVEPAAWAYWLLPVWLTALAAAVLIKPCLSVLAVRPTDGREE